MIYDNNRDEKLQYDINRYLHYHQVKLINMNILQAQKYYLLIKLELQSKVSLLL